MKIRALLLAASLFCAIAGCKPAQPPQSAQPTEAEPRPAAVDPGLRPKTANSGGEADSPSSDSPPPPDTPSPKAAARGTVLADTIDGAPATDAWIADNPLLSKALVGIWTPDASGSILANSQDKLDAELLRSRIYINAGKKSPPKHEGNLIAYTDSHSLVAVDGATAKPYGLPAPEVMQLALDMKMGLYLHYEGTASVFHAYEQSELKALLAKVKKKP